MKTFYIAFLFLFLIHVGSTKTLRRAICPKNQPLVHCYANPCDTATCENFPQAECRANYCGGCNAEFFINGEQVDCDGDLCRRKKCRRNEVCVLDQQLGKATCVKKPCPEFCTKIYAPVCGSDGNTYSNECLLKIESCQSGKKIVVVSKGECPICPKNQPLVRCYANPCDTATCENFPEAECRANYCGGCNAEFFINGEQVDCDGDLCKTKHCAQNEVCVLDQQLGDAVCVAKPCPEYCIEIYAPVCGSDGNTYSNECKLEKASCDSGTQITVAYKGECNQGVPIV